jgi:hypothetical protein
MYGYPSFTEEFVMSDGWYYSRDGKSFGPFVLESLQQLAATGHLRLTDLLWKDGMKEWKPVAAVKQVFQTPKAQRRYAPGARTASGPFYTVRVFLIGAVFGLGLGLFLGVLAPWAYMVDQGARDASEQSVDLVSDQEQGENGIKADKRPTSVKLTSGSNRPQE